MQQLNNPRMVHTFREQNRVVDALAKEGLRMEFFDVPTVLEVPHCVSNKFCRQTL